MLGRLHNFYSVGVGYMLKFILADKQVFAHHGHVHACRESSPTQRPIRLANCALTAADTASVNAADTFATSNAPSRPAV